MSLWLAIAGTLLIQEGVATLGILFVAYQRHYPLLAIHGLWLVIAVAEVYLGYALGKWIQKRFADSKFERWVRKHARTLETTIGKQGEAVALVLLGGFAPPGVAGLLGSFLELSPRNIFIFSLLGNLIWYASVWATLIGASHIASTVRISIFVFLIAVAAIGLIVKVLQKK